MSRMRLKNHIFITVSDKILLVILIILIVTFLFIRLFSVKSVEYLNVFVQKELTNRIMKILNDAAVKTIKDYNGNAQFVILNYNDKGEIISVDFDNKLMNECYSKIVDNFLEDIENYKIKNTLEVKIPFGIVHDNIVLSNLTPKIPYKLYSVASSDNSVYIDTQEYGINNSIIKVYFQTNIEYEIIFPFISKNVKIKKDLLIDSKIIQGKIPTYYGGLIGNTVK